MNEIKKLIQDMKLRAWFLKNTQAETMVEVKTQAKIEPHWKTCQQN